MKFRIIQTAFCAVIISALALTGCSERTNEQRYETPADDPAVESSGESTTSSEESTTNSEMSSVDPEPESSGESTVSSSEYVPDELSWRTVPNDELWLDRQILETVEQDRLCAMVDLDLDEEALREEYNELYPNIGENPYHWFRFLCDRGEQIVREFMSDYDLNYEDYEVGRSWSEFSGELNKDTVSMILDDPRVYGILYYPTGFYF